MDCTAYWGNRSDWFEFVFVYFSHTMCTHRICMHRKYKRRYTYKSVDKNRYINLDKDRGKKKLLKEKIICFLAFVFVESKHYVWAKY